MLPAKNAKHWENETFHSRLCKKYLLSLALIHSFCNRKGQKSQRNKPVIIASTPHPHHIFCSSRISWFSWVCMGHCTHVEVTGQLKELLLSSHHVRLGAWWQAPLPAELSNGSLYLAFFPLCFWDRVLLCSSDWQLICTNPLASTSQVLGFQAVTTSGSNHFYEMLMGI